MQNACASSRRMPAFPFPYLPLRPFLERSQPQEWTFAFLVFCQCCLMMSRGRCLSCGAHPLLVLLALSPSPSLSLPSTASLTQSICFLSLCPILPPARCACCATRASGARSRPTGATVPTRKPSPVSARTSAPGGLRDEGEREGEGGEAGKMRRRLRPEELNHIGACVGVVLLRETHGLISMHANAAGKKS